MFSIEVDDTASGMFENETYATPLAYSLGYCPGAFGPSPRSCQSSSRGALACGCFTMAEGELNDVKSASWAPSSAYRFCTMGHSITHLSLKQPVKLCMGYQIGSRTNRRRLHTPGSLVCSVLSKWTEVAQHPYT